MEVGQKYNLIKKVKITQRINYLKITKIIYVVPEGEKIQDQEKIGSLKLVVTN